MEARQKLRLATYRRFKSGLGFVCRCPWCEEPIEQGEFDLHEAIIKRSAVAKDKQDLIFVPENVVPLHHQCHMDHGQTLEMKHRCLLALVRVVSAEKVGTWYVSLWQEHGLSVPRGLLIPRKDVPISDWMRYMDLGARVHGKRFNVLADSEWQIETDEKAWDYRALAAMKWKETKKKGWRKPPEMWNNTRFAELIEALDEGYWTAYLGFIVGLDLDAVQA